MRAGAGKLFVGEGGVLLAQFSARLEGETTVEAILVYITAGSAEEAERIATTLLEQRLVACVNTVHGVESRYWWHGALERAEESLLLAKTVRDCWPRLLAAVREIHSYEVFDAVAIPILEGEPAYLEWIRESTAREAVC